MRRIDAIGLLVMACLANEAAAEETTFVLTARPDAFTVRADWERSETKPMKTTITVTSREETSGQTSTHDVVSTEMWFDADYGPTVVWAPPKEGGKLLVAMCGNGITGASCPCLFEWDEQEKRFGEPTCTWPEGKTLRPRMRQKLRELGTAGGEAVSFSDLELVGKSGSERKYAAFFEEASLEAGRRRAGGGRVSAARFWKALFSSDALSSDEFGLEYAVCVASCEEAERRKLLAPEGSSEALFELARDLIAAKDTTRAVLFLEQVDERRKWGDGLDAFDLVYADALWASGDRDEARERYRQIEEASANELWDGALPARVKLRSKDGRSDDDSSQELNRAPR